MTAWWYLLSADNLPILGVAGVFMISILYRQFRVSRLRTRLPQLMDPNTLIIDVRTPVEYLLSQRSVATNIPLERLGEKTAALDRKKAIVLCCKSAEKSRQARTILESKGFKNVANVKSCEELGRQT